MAKPPRITPDQLRASAYASLQDAASQQDVDRALLALGIWWRARPDGRLRKLWRTAVEIATALQDESRLAELVVALDGWLRGGGFLPRAWREVAVRIRTGGPTCSCGMAREADPAMDHSIDCPRSVESDDSFENAEEVELP